MNQQQHVGQEPKFIKNLFSEVAGTYDRANDVMTMGLARLWRRELVKWSDAQVGSRVIDCATGTGDLAIEFKKVVGSGRVLGTDFCKEMLDFAPAKARALGLDVEFAVADAMNLGYPDASFDIASIAYGIRNVADPVRALSEMARVVRPGGVVMVLETGDVQTPVLKPLLKLYFKHMVPLLGGMISGKKWAYQYLNKSSQAFPSGDAFLELMRKTGAFSFCECKSLMGGASYIYKAVRK